MKDNVLSAIGKGRANATSRDELVKRTGLSDRWVREHIHQHRLTGKPPLIGSTSRDAGYWQCVTVAEIDETLADMESKYAKGFEVCRAMRQAARLQTQVSYITRGSVM